MSLGLFVVPSFVRLYKVHPICIHSRFVSAGSALKINSSRSLPCSLTRITLRRSHILTSKRQKENKYPNSDGLTRYPSIYSPNGILRGLDWLGTVSFTASGAITAGYVGMDYLGCTLVGAITATGGGTIRDILLGNLPVFWMKEVEYLWLVLVTVGITLGVYSSDLKDSFWGENGSFLYITDSLGLGTFAVVGAQNAVRMNMPAVVCIVCGMVTATFGGVIRDVLCFKPPRIIYSHAEIYATTAIAGAASFVLLRQLQFSPAVRIFAGVFTAVAMRHWATTNGITLPVARWYAGKIGDDSRFGVNKSQSSA